MSSLTNEVSQDKLTVEGKTISLADVTAVKYGWAPIQLDMYNGIAYKNFLIEWHELRWQKNYNKLSISLKSNSGIWLNLYFTNSYNVQVLMCFLDWKFQKHEEAG